MIIIKTSDKTIKEVVRHNKHALTVQPRLKPGDLILISQTRASLPTYAKPIQYIMEYERCYEDQKGESARIWNKSWRYIIEGRGCRRLKNPFDISEVQVTDKEYGRGGPIVYVKEEDIRVLKDRGFLE